MASSRNSSNSPDWKDVATAIHSFQESESVSVAVTLTATEGRKGIVMCVTAVATLADAKYGEAKKLASASVTCSDTNLRSLEGAILHCLYALDFQLAANAAKRVLD